MNEQDLEHVTTQGGMRLSLRLARPGDDAAIEALFDKLTPEDLRFRFLSSVRHVPHEQIAAMTRSDQRTTRNLLGFDARDGTLVSTAMLACDDSLDAGEVAVVVRRDCKHRGIGWEMLRAVVDQARALGVGMIASIESRENRTAIALEREMGFTAASYPEDPALILLSKDLRPA